MAININNLSNVGGAGHLPEPGRGGAGKATSASGFADALKQRIDEVAKLQQDASQAVDSLVTGQSEDVSGVMSAVEKSDLAFKTLLAIRSKLMDAYDEIKNMQV